MTRSTWPRRALPLTRASQLSRVGRCARSLGDAAYKHGPRGEHLICAEPDVFTIELEPAHEFVVLASDGVWDVLSEQQACDIVTRALAERADAPDLAARALVKAAYEAESEDNISAVVLLLDPSRLR